ncbi:hypothetical protein VNI00_006106 [Paramarasmius palmivorus]|uniref:Uncharacterized protein n=1 Tax=Paramarasmius palmivorus TaxID=297713 RepID=A0AAW0D926_9AGAR
MVQLDGDSLLECLEHHFKNHGNQRASGYLTITKTLGTRLRPLLDTLVQYPQRSQYVKSLWVRLGREGLCAPALKDNTYPPDYTPYLLLPVHISEEEVPSLSKALQLVTPSLTRLTITAKCHYPRLRDSFMSMDFPKLVELDVPVDLVLLPDSEYSFEGLVRYSELRKLRLTYNSEADSAMDPLSHQDFTQLTQLTHLYIAYWAEYRSDVEQCLPNLRVPESVTVVVLEQDRGVHLPIRFDSLGNYTIHPKTVFVIEKGLLDQFDRVLGHSPRMRTVHGTCMVFDVKTIRDEYMWDRAEEKVLERWTLFNRIPSSAMLPTKWTGGRVIHKLR